MFAQLPSRFGLAVIAALAAGSTLLAFDPARPCRGCGQSVYRPPTIHAGTIFGYYPTTWSPWPGSTFGLTGETPPPLAPPSPEVEPLPLPRTPHGQRIPPKSPALLPISPAAYQYSGTFRE
jgi:hypothetical protein